MNDINFHKMIKEICKEKNIEIEVLSFGWIIKLRKGKKVSYITDYFFDVNTEASSYIAGDKYATYEVLKSFKIPVIEHKMVIKEAVNVKEIKEYYQANNEKLVVKANQGFEGKQVYLCEDFETVKENIQELLIEHRTISLCPFYDIKTEYRTIYIEGDCILTYAKTKSKSSWMHNLANGARAKLVEDKQLLEKLHKMTKEVAKAMNIRFASIDIIQTKANEFYVMEVNSGVCMKNFIKQEGREEQIREIYTRAIEKQMGE